MEGFDPNSFSIGAVSLIVVVFGLTQFLKDIFKLDGNKVRVLAFIVGAIVMISYQLIPLLAQPYEQIVGIVFYSLMFALTAAGYYQYGNRNQ